MPYASSIDVDNPKQNITNCFKMTHYVVPPFQREYVWGTDEVELLLSDIINAFESDREKEYFLGTTVVFRAEHDILQLIDGQQRIPSLLLDSDL